MFTGLISEVGEVVSLRRQGGGALLTVKARGAAGEAAVGDSIAVSGACLTVTEIKGSEVSFDLSEETLGSSTLGALKPGDAVNIEESLRADSKLGGHFVTGHVDAVGKITARTSLGDAWKYEMWAPPEVMDFLVEKGSVCVDGISLTVVDVLRDSFTLIIIPHTAQVTTMGSKGPGDAVNLEADIIGKYVYRFVKRQTGGGSLMDTLKREGYVGAE